MLCVYMLFMQYYVHGVIIDSVVCIWCSAHVGYMMLFTYCIVCMMDIRCCTHMVLCACWICNFV